MKLRMTLSIALVLSMVMLSLPGSGSAARAQQRRRFYADTGIVKLGPNQVLRVTVATGDLDGDGPLSVRFRRVGYLEQDNLYKIVSQTTSAPLMLAQGEAATIEIPDAGFAVRGIVLGNLVGTDRNVRATAQIVNTSTGEVTSHIIIANTEGDSH